MNFLKSKKILMLGTAVLVATPAVLLSQNTLKASSSQAPESISLMSTPAVSDRKEAEAYITPVDGGVELTLMNDSPSVISFMVPGNSRFEEIAPNQSVSFTTDDLPSFIGFRQLDGGLTYAEVSSVAEDGMSATISLQHLEPTAFYENPDLVTRSIVVSEGGGIFID